MHVPAFAITAALVVLTLPAAWSRPARVPMLEASAADSLPRCYDLILGSWTIASAAADVTEPVVKRIGLTSRPFRTRGDTLEYWAVAWRTDSLHQFGIWRPARDSVSVRFPTWGTWGLGLHLAEHRDSVTGQARVHGDFAPFKPAVAPVRGSRVPCPVLPVIGNAGA